MTVKELRNKLAEYPSDAEIFYFDPVYLKAECYQEYTEEFLEYIADKNRLIIL